MEENATPDSIIVSDGIEGAIYFRFRKDGNGGLVSISILHVESRITTKTFVEAGFRRVRVLSEDIPSANCCDMVSWVHRILRLW